MCLILMICFCIFLWFIRLNKHRQNRHSSTGQQHQFPLPPVAGGGYPIVGFLFHFIQGRNYSAKLIEMKKKWGNICTVQMGSYRCVWINDAKLIREAWSNPIFCGRPKIPGIISRTYDISGGIIFNDGCSFQEQRRFALKTLKHLGFRQNLMEDLIKEEANDLLESLRRIGPTPISTRHFFNVASINALWKIVTGEKLGNIKHDPNDRQSLEISKLVEALDRNMELSPGIKAGFFMPWLTKLCPNLIGWSTYLKDSNDIFNFWKKYAQKRIDSYDPLKSNHDNFIDLYIKEVKECQDEDSSFFGKSGEISLALVLQDLFIAGTETTATTLCWSFLFLAVFPDVQSKVYVEISTVIRPENQPSLSHKSSMIYTEAFIQEVLRFGTLAPLGMLHRCLEDTIFHGYFIPKDTIMQANICVAHHDNNYWSNNGSPPREFDPERFILRSSDDDGNEIMKLQLRNIGFLAFSFGKKNCLGEGLARDELFLFITTIVKEFEIVIDPSYIVGGDILEPIIGVSAIPKPHKIIFKSRPS